MRRMVLFIVNEHSDIENDQGCVRFKYKESAEDPFVPISKVVDVRALQSLSPDDKSYYSTVGKVFIGNAPPKETVNGSLVKEDIFIADNSGKIEFHVWKG